jgi:hypothetical protein
LYIKNPRSSKRSLGIDCRRIRLAKRFPSRHTRPNHVKPGTVGASFQAQIGSKSQSLFWAYPDCLQNALSDISKRGAPPSAFEDYRPAVAKFPGFNHEEVLSKSQPMTKFSKLTEETVKAFVAESQTLVLSWKRSVEAAGT